MQGELADARCKLKITMNVCVSIECDRSMAEEAR